MGESTTFLRAGIASERLKVVLEGREWDCLHDWRGEVAFDSRRLSPLSDHDRGLAARLWPYFSDGCGHARLRADGIGPGGLAFRPLRRQRRPRRGRRVGG